MNADKARRITEGEDYGEGVVSLIRQIDAMICNAAEEGRWRVSLDPYRTFFEGHGTVSDHVLSRLAKHYTDEGFQWDESGVGVHRTVVISW